MHNTAFIQTLTATVQTQRALVASDWELLPDALLTWQPGVNCWSALECIEHLNRYSSYYNLALEAALNKAQTTANAPDAALCYSWLGRKSVELVRPANGRAHKTLPRMNPSTVPQPKRTVLHEFIGHQTRLLHLLERAAFTNLNRRVVPVEFFKLLKLRLGEAFEFVVQHQQRHLLQAGRAIEQGNPTAKPTHSVN